MCDISIDIKSGRTKANSKENSPKVRFREPEVNFSQKKENKPENCLEITLVCPFNFQKN